jgi:sugar/nucleoside kinase (ribokinase family)
MSVTIVGTVALDTIETPVGKHERILGGSATFAGTAASIFSNTSLVSIVGKDFPQSHIDYFKNRNINIDGIEMAEGNTFHWSGYYKDDMNQAYTVATELNVLLDFDPVVPESAKNTKIAFLANVDPVLQKKAIEQFNSPDLVILDSMNFWIENNVEQLKDTLKLVDVLIINDQEIRLLTGIKNIIEAMPKILEMGPKRIIVKKGEHGSIMFNGKDYFICPAFPLEKLVDPTGAGDSFAGGFSGYLAQADNLDEETFKKAVIVGALVSSFTVQGFSLETLKNLTKDQLNEKYEKLKNFTTFPNKI